MPKRKRKKPGPAKKAKRRRAPAAPPAPPKAEPAPARPDAVGAMVVVEPRVPSRGYASPYREQKLAAHTTVQGLGRVARALA
jgi:hypothetical protein